MAKRWAAFLLVAVFWTALIGAQELEEIQSFCSVGALREGMTQEQFDARVAGLRERGNRLAKVERAARAQRGEAPLPDHVVRIAYLIPSNRQPQDLERIRYGVKFIQSWYADQMDRHGFGPKTFVLEMEEDGVTPKVYVVFGNDTDAQTPTDSFEVSTYLQELGLPIFADEQNWLEIVECHIINESSVALNFRYNAIQGGNGSQGGAATITADLVVFMRPEFLTDNTPYDNLLFPELGPYPMKQGLTYASGLGDTLSHLVSSALSITGHELGHAFGFYHCHINTEPWRGDIMHSSIGAVGIRGWARPDLYPMNYSILWHGHALALNVNRFFNVGQIWSDNKPPTGASAGIIAGEVPPGNVGWPFQASDSEGLSCALLVSSFDSSSLSKAYLLLENNNITTQFLTSNYHGRGIIIYDISGNQLKLQTGNGITGEGNHLAPEPTILASPITENIDQPFWLDASLSQSSIGLAGTTVEWDTNGDGVFDTLPTTEKTFMISYNDSGFYLIQARLTDSDGFSALSSPIAIHVVERPNVPDGWLAR
jgi:hypothetical protein